MDLLSALIYLSDLSGSLPPLVAKENSGEDANPLAKDPAAMRGPNPRWYHARVPYSPSVDMVHRKPPN